MLPKLKNQHPDLNWGPTDYQANTEPLCYAGLLILIWTEWIFILNGWGRGIKSVFTQIQTQDTQIMRQPLNHWAMQACLFEAHVHKITNGHGLYTALCVMILMRANPLLGPLQGGWAAALACFGPKFQGPKQALAAAQPPSNGPSNGLAQVMDLPASKSLPTGPYKDHIH